jgi:hypothetical protein
MENLEIYNKIKEVPKEAKKTITGGRLSGMTDIKPMWRIEKLTEMFGVCGFGWKAPITNKEIIEGANGEKIAIVDIELFVKIDNKWSEGITGTGGSSFIAKEKQGLYTSDECFKMAYTDALSVACKSLGMGADVYWGDSKYDTRKEATLEDAEKWKFGEKYKKHSGELLSEVIKNDPKYVEWYLNTCANEYDKKCYELLTGIKIPTEQEQDERIKLINELNQVELEYDIPHEKTLEVYKVDSTNEMTAFQLTDAIAKIKSSKGVK